jgi:hypothetical protein
MARSQAPARPAVDTTTARVPPAELGKPGGKEADARRRWRARGHRDGEDLGHCDGFLF